MTAQYDLAPGCTVMFGEIEEVRGMGGPCVSTVTVNGRALPGRYAPPPCLLAERGAVALARYYGPTGSASHGGSVFRVALFDLAGGALRASSRAFRELSIVGEADGHLVVYESMHGTAKADRRLVPLTPEAFA